MATPKISDADLQKTIDAYVKCGSTVKAGALLNMSRSAVRERLAEAKRRGLTVPDKKANTVPAEAKPLELVHKDRELDASKREASQYKKMYEAAKAEMDNAEWFQSVSSILDHKDDPPACIPASRKGNEAVPVIMISDVHPDATVDPETIYPYVNEFNPVIAEKSLDNVYGNACTLIAKERLSVMIRRSILWLGGDMMENYLREENVESNSMSPMEALLWNYNRHRAGIKYLLDNGDLENLDIVTNNGNHGRMRGPGESKKKHSTDWKNNADYALYRLLQEWFNTDKRVKFHITKSYFNTFQIFDWRGRSQHGDDVMYMGGTGGLTIPLNRKIAGWNRGMDRPPHFDLVGHFHQRGLDVPASSAITNGSVIGYNSYAVAIGAKYEEPSQGFLLIDKQHGKTFTTPIFVR